MTHEERFKIISKVLDAYTPIEELVDVYNLSTINFLKDIINHPEPTLEIIKLRFDWLNEKLSKYNLKYYNVINSSYNENWSYIEDTTTSIAYYEYTQLINTVFEIEDNLLVLLTIKLTPDSKYYKYFGINYDS